jgi:hypothetical protein
VQQVVLAHLSETNNRPEIVLAWVQRELKSLDPSFTLALAGQATPTSLFSVDE